MRVGGGEEKLKIGTEVGGDGRSVAATSRVIFFVSPVLFFFSFRLITLITLLIKHKSNFITSYSKNS
jgi:hypothetical protein